MDSGKNDSQQQEVCLIFVITKFLIRLILA